MSHQVEVQIDELTFTIGSSEATGRQLLELAGFDPTNYMLAQVIQGAPDHLVDPEETIELFPNQRFSSISKQRYYNFSIDEQSFSRPEAELTGRQLLALVGKSPETHLLNYNLPNQDDVLIDADEIVDLRQPGRERFSVTVRKLTITIEDVQYHPPKATMLGSELRALAKPAISSDLDLWLDVPGKDDRRIKDDEAVALKDGMVFYTAPSTINPGLVSLPKVDQSFLENLGYPWRLVNDGDKAAFLIIDQFDVSGGGFKPERTSLMVRIPELYNMTPLDMWYCDPPILLNGQNPDRADERETHAGRVWQRFSRHFSQNAWRPGRDNLRTLFCFIGQELQGKEKT